MLPAATSCSNGFHRCLRDRSISVMPARPRRPRLSPSRVASSRPPAPPPTITILCMAASVPAARPTRGVRKMPLVARDSRAVLRGAALLEELQQRRRIVERLLVFVRGTRIGHDAATRPAADFTPRMDERADRDVEIHVALEPDIADRAAVHAAAVRLQ